MNKWRDRKARSVLGAVAMVNALGLALAGCGTGGESEDRPPSKGDSQGGSASEGAAPSLLPQRGRCWRKSRAAMWL